MVPNIYSHEKLALQHRCTLFCQAEHERMLAMTGSPARASYSLPNLAGRLGTHLIALGTSLQRFEKRGKVVSG